MAEFIVTDENFNEEVLNSDIPVIVDFYADWCGPCKMQGPVLKEFAAENEGKIKVGKLNIEESTQTTVKYKVVSIPTLILFKGGDAVKTVVGFQTKAQLQDMIN